MTLSSHNRFVEFQMGNHPRRDHGLFTPASRRCKGEKSGGSAPLDIQTAEDPKAFMLLGEKVVPLARRCAGNSEAPAGTGCWQCLIEVG
jgi:hypothetical protein